MGKAFRLLIVILALAGWSLVPGSSQVEEGSVPNRHLIISTEYPGAAAMQVEELVTSPLEARLSLVSGIEDLRSSSAAGQSRIEIALDHTADPVSTSRKIRMMCRLVSRTFPEQSGQAVVSFTGDQQAIPAITLNIRSDLPHDSVYRWLNPRLAVRIEGMSIVEKIDFQDVCHPLVEMEMNPHQLQVAGITPADIVQAIRFAGREFSLAESGDNRPTILWPAISPVLSDLDSILIFNENHTPFRLSQLIRHTKKQQCPSQRWRNGQPMFGVNIYVQPASWTRENLDKIMDLLRAIEGEAEGNMGIEVIQNNLKTRLDSSNRIFLQCAASASILVVLLLSFTGRQQAFFLLLLLIGSLGISFVGLIVMGKSLSIHVIGGLTLGLGMAADNGIMVTGSVSGPNRVRQILPVLAATLTTLVPLVLVQWADIPAIQAMSGFCVALALVLSASLVVCWAVFPVLPTTGSHVGNPPGASSIGLKLIARIHKDRRWIYVGIVLLMGIPIPELPDRIQTEHTALNTWYRHSVGSYEFQHIWQPRILDWIGGISRPFIKQIQRGESSPEQHGPTVELRALANPGTYPEQVCELGARIEQELLRKKIPGILVMRSCGPGAGFVLMIKVNGSKDATRQIEELYRWFLLRARGTSGLTWSLSGLGKGWSNEKIPDQQYHLTLQGYEYLRLVRWASEITDSLKRSPGILEATIGSPSGKSERMSFRLNQEVLARESRDAFSFLNEAGFHTVESQPSGVTYDEQGIPVPFRLIWSSSLSASEFLAGSSYDQSASSPRSRFLERDSLMDSFEILKENQTYQLRVNWSYAGSVRMGERLEKAIRARLENAGIPGCSLRPVHEGPVWDLPFLSAVVWLIPVLGLMFVICAIFMESFLFAYFILLTIPLGWIGAMGIIVAMSGSLDAGAVAGFFLVTGLSVNHAIFLLMPLRTKRRLVAADVAGMYRRKLRPILLTLVSTVLTFGPFCFQSGADPFWTHLSIVTIAGLVVGLSLTLILLPAMVGINHSRNSNSP